MQSNDSAAQTIAASGSQSASTMNTNTGAIMKNKPKNKIANTKPCEERAGGPSARGRLVAALAAGYALQACENAGPASAESVIVGVPEVVSKIRRSFADRGVRFTKKGTPKLPAITLKTPDLDDVDADALLLGLAS